MKNKTNILEKIGNTLLFKGDLSRLSFLIGIFLMLMIYHCFLDITITNRLDRFFYTTYVEWIGFCYIWGILIAGRLRNLKINPTIAYFFVVGLWVIQYVLLRYGMPPIFARIKAISMLEILVILPLFVTDKKTLQFWKNEQ